MALTYPAGSSCSMPGRSYSSASLSWSSHSSFSLGSGHCSIWVWCPCSPYEDWGFCWRGSSGTLDEKSCPQEDVTNKANCAGAGSWYLYCGDGCQGPPCRRGFFYNEVVLMCPCPTYAIETDDWDTKTPYNSHDCGGTPENQDVPLFGISVPEWPGTKGIVEKSSDIPQIIFPIETCEPNNFNNQTDNPIGWWTWCICDGGPESMYYHGTTNVVRVIDESREHIPPIPDADLDVLGDYTQKADVNDRDSFDKTGWCLWWDDTNEEWVISGTCDDRTGNIWTYADVDGSCPFGDYDPAGGAEGVLTVTPECPWPPSGVNCGPYNPNGRWVFRGGCVEAGAPPNIGSAPGETVAIYLCCPASEWEPSSSSEPSQESEFSCSELVDERKFDWTLEELSQTNNVDDITPGEENSCQMPTDAVGWAWCQCPDDQSLHCDQTIDEKPYWCWSPWHRPNTPWFRHESAQNGHWIPVKGTPSDDRLMPPARGLFYGQVLWWLDFCAQSSLSSSNPCVCNDANPGLNFTITFAGGGTKNFLGTTFSSGETHEICADTYTYVRSGATSQYGSETWKKLSGSQSTYFRLYAYQYYSAGYDRITVNRPGTTTGNILTIVWQYAANSRQSSATKLSTLSFTDNASNPPAGCIIPRHFGQFTTNDGITVTYEQCDPAQWCA